MSETSLTIDQLKFTYEGIFDLAGLYEIIDSFFYEKGYDKYEKLNTELVLPSGRHIKLEILPFKSITDYFQLIIKIRLDALDVKDVEVEADGSTAKLQEGKVTIIFDGYVKSDRYSKWENRPFFWFLRVLFDKYVFKEHFSKAEKWLYSDVEDIYQRIKSFLNVYRNAHSRDTIGRQVF